MLGSLIHPLPVRPPSGLLPSPLKDAIGVLTKVDKRLPWLFYLQVVTIVWEAFYQPRWLVAHQWQP